MNTSMDAHIKMLIEELHSSKTRAVIVLAGGGAQAIAWLLGSPGASGTILEVLAPYSPSSFIEFLGYKPRHFVSAETANDMARLAYERALFLREGDVPVIGVAITASMVTDRRKRGPHRCHSAAWNHNGVKSYSVELLKGARDRTGEDGIVSKLLLRTIADITQMDSALCLMLDEKEEVESHSIYYEDPINAFFANHVRTVTVSRDGTISADKPVTGGVLPGAFNPLHKGHQHLAAVASTMLNAQVTFELSIANVDKPPLSELMVRERIAQFLGNYDLVVTDSPDFFQKARLFPGSTLIMGWDTATRLINPIYYNNQPCKMLTALAEIRDLGCQFLVAGREEKGSFHSVQDLTIPKGFEDLFTPIPESVFRYDISSSALRSKRNRK